MNKQRKNCYGFILSILNHFSIFAGLSLLIILINTSCEKNGLSVLYKDTQKYIVNKDDSTLKIISQKIIDDSLENDTTVAYYVDGEYRLADGSLFMSTKSDTSYTKLFDPNQKQLIIIHPIKDNDKNSGYYTQVLNSFIGETDKHETKNSSSIVEEDYFGKESAVIWMVRSYIYDKNYKIIEIQEMNSFTPTGE